MHQRITRVLKAALILLTGLLALIILYRLGGDIRAHFTAWYRDTRLVAWAGVVANLAVVGIALFLNMLLDKARQPRFRVTCREVPPWQIAKEPERLDPELLFVRLRVQNVGRTCEEACEVRVEQVFRLFSGKDTKPQPINDHDPRPLKWVGRDTKPITLNRGAFDFVDLGLLRADSREHFRLDFADRGHLDLWLNEKGVTAFRIAGTVYGKRAKPKPFAFDLSWKSFEFGPIVVEEV